VALTIIHPPSQIPQPFHNSPAIQGPWTRGPRSWIHRPIPNPSRLSHLNSPRGDGGRWSPSSLKKWHARPEWAGNVSRHSTDCSAPTGSIAKEDGVKYRTGWGKCHMNWSSVSTKCGRSCSLNTARHKGLSNLRRALEVDDRREGGDSSRVEFDGGHVVNTISSSCLESSLLKRRLLATFVSPSLIVMGRCRVHMKVCSGCHIPLTGKCDESCSSFHWGDREIPRDWGFGRFHPHSLTLSFR
jgi:hypothetical protein